MRLSHSRIITRLLHLAWGLLLPVSLAAQADRPATEDNSILIEEAYNQEFGVVQHITTLAFDGPRRRDLAVELTQEWPFATQRDQFSYTVSLLRPDAGSAGPGDVQLHYRRQFGMGGRPWALAPSVSLILPSGSVAQGRGDGSAGVELGLPLSVTLSRDVVTHWNASVSILPWARTAAATDRHRTLTGASLGASVIAPMRRPVQLMVESLVAFEDEFTGPGRVGSVTAWTLSPAVRVAINLGGLQLVPAVALPITTSDGTRQTNVILYLSAEHAFRPLRAED